MPLRNSHHVALLAFTLGLVLHGALHADFVQWDFDDVLDATTEGDAPLEPKASFPLDPAEDPAPHLVYVDADIGGETARVLCIDRGVYFRVHGGFGPNGGGLYVNQYTLIMDVMFPGRSGWTALYNANVNHPASNDGESWINPDGQLGVGTYAGSAEDGTIIAADTWYRIAIAVDGAGGELRYYIDGVPANVLTSPTVDGRFALWSTSDGDLEGLALFSDNDAAGSYVSAACLNSLRFVNTALTDAEAAELGGPAADGIPLPTVDPCADPAPEDDCNGNDVLDSCDVTEGGAADCNGDLIPDECQLTENDCDANGIPDDCDLDCNANGVPDACDLADATSADCNANGLLDECELAQWDFDGDFASSTGQPDLVPAAYAPSEALAVSFVQADIGGEAADVLDFAAGTLLRAEYGFAPSGGGDFVNQYTLIMDVRYPENRAELLSGWTALYNTNIDNANDGDWYIDGDGGLGISGTYGGEFQDGAWQRIGLVVDLVAQTFTCYLNGAQVNQLTGGGLTVDGRWSLFTHSILLFAEGDGSGDYSTPGQVNSVQLRAYAMSPEEMATLGGPSASGIPGNDCNANGVLDGCELEGADCNANSVLDECELSSETDCDSNGVLDACELDGADCDGNLVLDVCELAEETDCDTSGALDACEIADGTLADDDEDGVPDVCQGGLQIPGDCNQDSDVNISDASCLLGFLFLGDPLELPCGDGTKTARGNVALLDWNGDSAIDIADGAAQLNWLFRTAPPHRGWGDFGIRPCLPIPDCLDECGE